MAMAGFGSTLAFCPAAISIQDDRNVLGHVISHQLTLERAFIEAIDQIAHSLRLLLGPSPTSRRRVFL
jgi:hypothetical protein